MPRRISRAWLVQLFRPVPVNALLWCISTQTMVFAIAVCCLATEGDHDLVALCSTLAIFGFVSLSVGSLKASRNARIAQAASARGSDLTHVGQVEAERRDQLAGSTDERLAEPPAALHTQPLTSADERNDIDRARHRLGCGSSSRPS